MNMQDKLLDAVKAAVEDAGLEYVRQSEWSNTGHVYAQRGFETFVVLEYQFNANYATLSLRGSAVDALSLTDSPPNYRAAPHNKDGSVSWSYLEYTNGDRILGFLAVLARALKTVAVT